MGKEYYAYVPYDMAYHEFEYGIYNQVEEMWLCGLSAIAEYSKNQEAMLRFSNPTLADQLCVQLEDVTHQAHIVFME